MADIICLTGVPVAGACADNAIIVVLVGRGGNVLVRGVASTYIISITDVVVAITETFFAIGHLIRYSDDYAISG
jgi:hypothetical protein